MAETKELTPEEEARIELERKEEQRQLEVLNWIPPVPPFGSIILFYQDGMINAKPPIPMVVYMKSRSGRTLSMRPLAGGEARTGVRFIHDPRLESMSTEERISAGAWDFTEEHYQVQKLQSLVKELLESDTGKKSPGRPSKTDPKVIARIESLEKSINGINDQLVAFFTANKKS